jgi:hypothetical protein
MGGNPAHVRLTLNQVGVVANAFADSGLFKVSQRGGSPRSFTPQECFAVIMAGQSLGLGPFPSMQQFHMIEGRPEMSANLQAYFLKSSPKYDYRAEFIYNPGGEADACQVIVYDKTKGESIGVSLFTRAMAEKAGLVRSGGNWDKYAQNMLFARAISNAVAWHAPDCIPFRIHSDGETSGQQPEQGVQAVQGEGPPSEAKVTAIVEQAIAADDAAAETEAVVDADEVPISTLEQRVRADLPGLSAHDKALVRQAVTQAGKPWGYASILDMMLEADFDDVQPWVDYLRNMLVPNAGVSGRKTSEQTEATVTDSQIRMLHARFSACAFSEPEKRRFLDKFAQVESTRDVPMRIVDDLLQVLGDIENGSPETRAAYIGGE